MLRLLAAALCAALSAAPASAVTSQLISVDFGRAADSTLGLFNGSEADAAATDGLFSGANVWNALDVVERGTNVGTPETPLYKTFPTQQSFTGLVDSAGTVTTVGLRIDAGARAFEKSGRDVLRGDYLYLGGRADTSTKVGFTLTGLEAGGSYALYVYAADSGNASRGFVSVDQDGDGALSAGDRQAIANDMGSGATDAFFALVSAGANGTIMGEFANPTGQPSGLVEDEVNIAGFQIARIQPIPLPAGAALLPAAFALAWAVRRRR